MTAIPFLDLKEQYREVQKETWQALEQVFATGVFILGENVATFEERFAAYCGTRYGIGVGSGTEALYLSLLACGVGSGDEVITAPNTAVPTVSAIWQAGATPVLVEIDRNTYTLDPQKLEEKITSRTRVLLPVHLYGHPADMDPILDIARRYHLTVIEDACQAHGAEYKGRKVGSFGDLGCFSFYPTKNLGGYGDGGMIITNNAETADALKLLRNHGQRERNTHIRQGLTSRLDELQAAILLVKLAHLEQWNERRRTKAQYYTELLACSGVSTPGEAAYARHTYHLYVIRSKRRNELQAFLSSQHIGTLIHYPTPIHQQEAYKSLGATQGSFPIAEQYASEVLSLPMYPGLEEEHIERVCHAIHQFHQLAP
jgi:dTDP-4-amino-4,6-dideoxygalactose transaminase